ncbi:MAG: hypothetical protein ACRD0P_06035 [Stackebrandtia sp.]
MDKKIGTVHSGCGKAVHNLWKKLWTNVDKLAAPVELWKTPDLSTAVSTPSPQHHFDADQAKGRFSTVSTALNTTTVFTY